MLRRTNLKRNTPQMCFNEHDKFAAQWLRNLWPDATVDERDIQDVRPDELVRFRRCHFFGGIGGWEYALELAGWPQERSVWTGSCPCQPFSSAGKRKGIEDERHLWPEFRRLIEECRPATIFGEQVASKDGRQWLAGVRADLEALGYAFGAADLCAASQGAPHVRQRLFWVGDSDSAQCGHGRSVERKSGSKVLAAGGEIGGMAVANFGRCEVEAVSVRQSRQDQAEAQQRRNACGLADCDNQRLAGLPVESTRKECAAIERSSWSHSVAVQCEDGRARRIESGSFPLAHRIPVSLGRRFPELRGVGVRARANRVGRLRGYGNAIVPQVAAEFIRAYLEAT